MPTGTKPTLLRLINLARVTATDFLWLSTARGSARPAEAEQGPATVLGDFAQDMQEEQLLLAFRRLNSRQRAAMVQFLQSMPKSRTVGDIDL
jgi:hypothetical protein